MPEADTVRESTVVYRGPRFKFPRVTSSRDVHRFFVQKLELQNQLVELFYVLHLNAKNAPIGFECVSRGSMTAAPVEVSSVFRGPILAGATQSICVHNHPSGEITPSAEDIALTERISNASKLIGIRLVDHVIIGDSEYFSFLDAGLLQADEK